MVYFTVKQSSQMPTNALETARKELNDEIKNIEKSESNLLLTGSSLDKLEETTLTFEGMKIKRRLSQRSVDSPSKPTATDKITVVLESLEHIKFSPCKVLKVQDEKIGGSNLYKCAPREDQLNKFKGLECKTIYRQFEVELNKSNVKFNQKNFPVGCELRFTKSRVGCNKLMFGIVNGC